jgi:hypothetical protein
MQWPKEKRTNNNLQNTTQKTKDRATIAPLKPGITHVHWKCKKCLFHVQHRHAASLLATTLYQVNHERNHTLWNIASAERHVLHLQVLLECCYI